MSSNVTLTQVFNKLQDRFNPDNAKGLNKTFQFSLNDADSFCLTIEDSNLDAHWGEHSDPNITLIMDESTFIGVIQGEIDGMSAFMKGLLRAEGDVMLATKLGKLFRH